MRKFTEDHEWLDLVDGVATVGVTAYAIEQLGDLVFVDLPKIGVTLAKGDTAATVESVKAASDVYCPLDGEIVGVNDELGADPALANVDPEGRGWFFRLRLANAADADALLDETGYRNLVG